MPLEKRLELNKLMNPRYIYRNEQRSLRAIMFSDPKLIVDMHNDFYAWYIELKSAHRVKDLEDFGIFAYHVRNSSTRYNAKHNDNDEPLYSGIMDFSTILDYINQPITNVIDKIMICFFMTAFDSSAYGRKVLFNLMLDAHIMNKKANNVEIEILKMNMN